MKNSLEPNPIARFLGKPAADFKKADIIRYIERNNIGMVHFRYVGGDGRLKELNFVLTGREQLDRILSRGERVDGSSLFPFVDAASSDLYVVPRFRTAFLDPFSALPAVHMLCTFCTREGDPLASAAEEVARRAQASLKMATGMTLETMGELEYYVVSDCQKLFPVAAQKGYHESGPFHKWGGLREEAMRAIAATGGQIKYGHSEVGAFREGGREFEQHEIEFFPVALEDAADQIVVARWILRRTAQKYGVTVSFAPKVAIGQAGTGMHVHTRLVKNGRNMLVENGDLGDRAHKIIGGYLTLAPSLTAFGNPLPISYLRLVPHQEAPTNVCWGARNRSALVRVPLGWVGTKNMMREANPREKSPPFAGDTAPQTVEFRSGDGAAHPHLLMAGLAVAARHGLQTRGMADVAKRLCVDVNIFKDEHEAVRAKLPTLPTSCAESADLLLRDRPVYEKDGVFTPVTLDGIAARLQSFEDRSMFKPGHGSAVKVRQIVDECIDC